jgi:hypothetical protein
MSIRRICGICTIILHHEKTIPHHGKMAQRHKKMAQRHKNHSICDSSNGHFGIIFIVTISCNAGNTLFVERNTAVIAKFARSRIDSEYCNGFYFAGIEWEDTVIF